MKFNKDMIVDNDETDIVQCYDCLFSMNYNNEKILNGASGYNLDKYIEISSKYHAELYDMPCFRLTDNGGCYVCMKLLDIPFEKPKTQIDDKVNDKLKDNTNKDYTNKDKINNENVEDNEDNVNIININYVNKDDIVINL
jgi:hypothetical protein